MYIVIIIYVTMIPSWIDSPLQPERLPQGAGESQECYWIY